MSDETTIEVLELYTPYNLDIEGEFPIELRSRATYKEDIRQKQANAIGGNIATHLYDNHVICKEHGGDEWDRKIRMGLRARIVFLPPFEGVAKDHFELTMELMGKLSFTQQKMIIRKFI